MSWLPFLTGLLVGALCGLVVVALLSAAKDRD